MRPRSSGLHRGQRGLGHRLYLGGSGGVFHVLGHPPWPRTSGQMLASRDTRHTPAHTSPGGPGCGDGCDWSRREQRGSRLAGVEGLGLAQGHRGSSLVRAGSAHAWGGAPRLVPGGDRCHRCVRDLLLLFQLGLLALALGAELPSALPGPMLITRLGRAQHPSVTSARFMTMHDTSQGR